MESAAVLFQTALVARASAARDAQLSRAARRKRVLDEDEFVGALDQIIQRDYYPDLPLLRAQHELLIAIEADDPDRARRAYAMVGAVRPGRSRAAPGAEWDETPLHSPHQGLGKRRRPAGGAGADGSSLRDGARSGSAGAAGASCSQSLDEFLARHTSQDNASFSVILEQDKAAHRLKYWWAQDAPAGTSQPLRALGGPSVLALAGPRGEMQVEDLSAYRLDAKRAVAREAAALQQPSRTAQRLLSHPEEEEACTENSAGSASTTALVTAASTTASTAVATVAGTMATTRAGTLAVAASSAGPSAAQAGSSLGPGDGAYVSAAAARLVSSTDPRAFDASAEALVSSLVPAAPPDAPEVGSRALAAAAELERPWHKQGALIRDERPVTQEFHAFSHRNALYFVPEPHARPEFAAHLPKGATISKNTRFEAAGAALANIAATAGAAIAAGGGAASGRLAAAVAGPGGQCAQIGGSAFGCYSQVSTPTPSMMAPGESPLITWGAALGTPLRLDEGMGSYSGANPFKLPQLPPKDAVLHTLAAGAGRRIRAKARAARPATPANNAAQAASAGTPQLSQAGRRLARSLVGHASGGASPALVALAGGGGEGEGGGGGVDCELRASYGFTPSRVASRNHTPRLGSTSRGPTPHGATPLGAAAGRSRPTSVAAPSVGSTPLGAAGGVRAGAAGRKASARITDGLLDVPVL